MSDTKTCWCGGDVGPREPGDADGVGCLADITHDWRLRVMTDEQCCWLSCKGGACETCPCCSAGYCVWGTDFEADGIPTDRDEWLAWVSVAAEHNPVAKVLSNVLRELGIEADAA